MAAFLLQDEFPGLASELARSLGADGEADLAVQIASMRVIDPCRCGDSFCATMYARRPPRDASWGEGLRTIEVDVSEGMVGLDVVKNQIVAIEVLFRGADRSRLRELLP